jgi:glc operon protein GlcG
MSVLDWAGNLIESHAMEGAAANFIDTALLKAKSALRRRRPTSEMNKIARSGQNLAPTFMHDFPQHGALPIVVDGEVIGSMGVSSADGEKCAQAAIDAVFKKQGTPPRRKAEPFGSCDATTNNVSRMVLARPRQVSPRVAATRKFPFWY